jgi:hypothetical protein
MKPATVITALLVFLATGAMAYEVIDTYPCSDGTVTNGWEQIAQVFVVPAGNPVLSNYTFSVAPEGTITELTFSIFEWNDRPMGPELFSVTVDWPDAGGDVLIDNINVILTEGVVYAAIVYFDSEWYDGDSVHWMQNNDCYPDGDVAWLWDGVWQYYGNGWLTRFHAEFYGSVAAENTSWGEVKSLFKN